MNRFNTNKVLSLLFYSFDSYKNLFINAFILLKKVHLKTRKKCTCIFEKKLDILANEGYIVTRHNLGAKQPRSVARRLGLVV